ncbi:MAG: hypothetical protein FD180_4565 [Planctomycetota bacterium]|nr:MAG: hypothetical protein FD180_4565 [Planctomycetota bacterium]
MRQITPCRTLDGFRAAYDAGGRWWNRGAKAGDGVVSPGEAAAAAGNLLADTEALLQLALHLQSMPPGDRAAAWKMLNAKLLKKFEGAGVFPREASRFDAEAPPGSLAIVTGDAHELEPRDPGGVLPFIGGEPRGVQFGVTPVYLAFHLRDIRGAEGPGALVAWFRVEPALKPGRWAFAGRVHLLEPASERRGAWTRFLFAEACAPREGIGP